MAITDRVVRCPNQRTRPRRIPLAAVEDSLIDPGPSPEQVCDQRLLRDAVTQVLGRLRFERYQVLALTYGLPYCDGMNRAGYSYLSEEIARILRVTSYRIHVVRHNTLDMLRRSPDSRWLLRPFVSS
jgi:hypothetical protein